MLIDASTMIFLTVGLRRGSGDHGGIYVAGQDVALDVDQIPTRRSVMVVWSWEYETIDTEKLVSSRAMTVKLAPSTATGPLTTMRSSSSGVVERRRIERVGLR